MSILSQLPTSIKASIQGGLEDHLVLMNFITNSFGLDHPVIVHCDCQSFARNYEAALVRSGSATNHGNVMVTPKYKLGICNHLLYLALVLSRDQQSKEHANHVPVVKISNSLKKRTQ